MFKRFFGEIIVILIAIIVFSTIHFLDMHIKRIEEVRPFETVETGVVHNNDVLVELDEQKVEIDFEGTEDDIIRLTNEFRKEKGLDILVRDEKLMLSAKAKGEDMRDKKYFAHISPDGVELWNLVQNVDYKYSIIAENIAEGYFSAESVVKAWKNSEGHRKNMLASDFEDIGVSVVEIVNKNDRKSFVLVQHFAISQKALPKNQKVGIVCGKKMKKNCKKIDERKEEYRELVKDQEKIIENTEKEGFSRKDLTDLYDNLDKLKEVRDEYKEFSHGCDEYMNKCDRWE